MKINFDSAVNDFNTKREDKVNELGGQLFASVNDVVENGVPGRTLVHSEKVVFLENMISFVDTVAAGTNTGELPSFKMNGSPSKLSDAALPTGSTETEAKKLESVQEDLEAAMELISALVDGDGNVIYHTDGEVNREATIANLRDARKARDTELRDLKKKVEAAETAQKKAETERDAQQTKLEAEQSRTTKLPAGSLLTKDDAEKLGIALEEAMSGDFRTFSGGKKWVISTDGAETIRDISKRLKKGKKPLVSEEDEKK